MTIVTSANDERKSFSDIRDGEIFLNGNQNYCIRIPLVKDTEYYKILYNKVDLEYGSLYHTDDDDYVLPLPNSELHIKF